MIRSAVAARSLRIWHAAHANRQPILWACSAVLALWVGLNWFHTIVRIVGMYDPLPNWDYWSLLEHYDGYRRLDPRVLWQQHNEHRIVFPELTFAADFLLFRGRQILPLLVSFLCYFFAWVLLSKAVFEDKLVSIENRTLAILLAGVLMAWQGCAFVLGVPFLLQWTMTQTGVLASLVALTRVKCRESAAPLAVAIAAAAVATYSSANGILIWPILIVAAILLRLSNKQVATLAGSGALLVGLYFVDYHFSGASNVRGLLIHPLFTLAYLGSYLSMPFGGLRGARLSVVVGLAGLAAVAALGVAVFRRGLMRSPAAVVLFAAYGFAVLTGLLTAAGRMNISDTMLQSARAARYVSLPQQTWGVFVLICIWAVSRLRWRALAPLGLALIFAVLLLISFSKLGNWLRSNEQWSTEEQLGSLAVENGILDPKLLSKIFPDPAFVITHLPILRSHKLSIYAGGYTQWLGKPLASFSRVGGSASGAITFTFPVQSGLELAGWADESHKNVLGSWLVFTNQEQRIIGFGRRFTYGLPLGIPSSKVPASIGWYGFVNLEYPATSVSAYLIRHNHLDRIPGSVPIAPR